MKPEVHKAWIDALRSGEFKQCRNAMTFLEEDGTFSHCCLSVLNTIGQKANPDLNLRMVEGYWIDNELISPASRIAKSLVEWAGLTDQYFEIGDHIPAGLNDLDELTFEEIADILERVGPEDVK